MNKLSIMALPIVFLSLLFVLSLGRINAQQSIKLAQQATVPAKTSAPKPQPDKFILKLSGGYVVHIRPTGENGDTQYDDEILVLRKHKMIGRIDLHHLLEDWLKTDAIWGDHAEANQARYQHGNGDNLAGVVKRIVRKGKDAEVTLEWRLRFASRHDLEAVQLAQLTVAPTVGLRFIKVVSHAEH